MKVKNICFCVRIGNQKRKGNELGDAEKLSEQKTSDLHHNSQKKGKSRGLASATPADDGVPGVTTTGGAADAGVTAAVVSAVLVSAISANEGGSSHGHGGDSGGGDGGG